MSTAAVSFTAREREILNCLARGLSSKQIANDLRLQPKTIECHIERLRLKAGVRNRLHLIVTAIGVGIIDAPGIANDVEMNSLMPMKRFSAISSNGFGDFT